MSTFPRRQLPRRPASHRRLVAAIVAVGCGWVAYSIYGAVSAGHALDDRVNDLANQNTVLRQQIAERQQEIASAQSPAWLEAEARKLDYVKPGERTYVFASPGAVVPASGGVEVKLPVYPPPTPVPAGAPAPVPGQPTPSPSPTPTTFTLAPPPRH